MELDWCDLLDVRCTLDSNQILQRSEMWRWARKRRTGGSNRSLDFDYFVALGAPEDSTELILNTSFWSFWNQSDPNDVEEVYEFISSQQ
jgi:hypothetical protein